MIALRLTFVAALMLAAPAFAAAPIGGRWVTDDSTAIVEIAPCGTSLCGRIVQILAAAPKANGPLVDRNNPDPALRGRSIQGLTILSDFTDGGKQWNGRIYDPNSGRSYRSVAVRTPDGLRIKGCIGPFCRTVMWRPAR